MDDNDDDDSTAPPPRGGSSQDRSRFLDDDASAVDCSGAGDLCRSFSGILTKIFSSGPDFNCACGAAKRVNAELVLECLSVWVFGRV